MEIYTLHDTKTGGWRVPFFCHFEAEAVRQVVQAVSDDRTELHRFPSDFILYRIGTYDEATGVVSAASPVNLGASSSLYMAHIAANRPFTSSRDGIIAIHKED